MRRALMVAAAAAAVSAADPLFLSGMLQNGELDKAREMSRVNLPGIDFESYSGYFTVNESADSHTFFWYFPPLNGDKNAPTLTWLQGGPGSSSMFALFTELGAITVNADGTKAIPTEITWNRKYGMVFVDNPVGTGFSMSKKSGYARNRNDYMTTLYSFANQFFTMFPELQLNDFYITGESYAGKYVPAMAYRIHEENAKGTKPFIPLKGIVVGDGVCDPVNMVKGYPDLMEQFSLINWQQKKQAQKYVDETEAGIAKGDYLAAFQAFDLLINGDLSGVKPFLQNVTGFSNYFNALSPAYPPQPFEAYLNRPEVQKALHVNKKYTSSNSEVEEVIVLDWVQTMADLFPTLLENYKVLIYSGQFDVIVGAQLTVRFLRNLKWAGAKKFEHADRTIWHSRMPVRGAMGIIGATNDVAGWHQAADNLQFVVVRNAGHLVPSDQPVWALDMLTRFIDEKPFDGPVPEDVPNPLPKADTCGKVVDELHKLTQMMEKGHLTADEFAAAKKTLLL